MSFSDAEQAFLDLLVEQNMIDLTVAEDAKQRAHQRIEGGKEATPGEIVVERKWITADQLRRLRVWAVNVTPTCFKCLKRSIIPRGQWAGRFTCTHCGNEVSPEDRTAGFGEELLPNPPERLVDKIFEKLLVKASILNDGGVEKLKRKRRKRIPRPSLVDLAEEYELVDGNRLMALKAKAQAVVRKKVQGMGKLQNDYQLACFLCRLGVVSQKSLSTALQEQLDAAGNARYLALRELLESRKELTEHQIKKFLPMHFDRHSKRIVLMKQAGALIPEEDGIDEEGWQDSMTELSDEMEQTVDDLNVLSLDPPEAADDSLTPREREMKQMARKFENLDDDVDSLDDLIKQRR